MGYNLLIDIHELRKRQSWTLEDKIQWAIEKYIEYVEIFYKEGVYLSFSGGKDSQVLEDIIQKLHSGYFEYLLEFEYLYLYNIHIKGKPAPPNVFCDTGLEFPEIRKHVKKFNNVTRLRPKMKFTEVIEKFGFLIGSKIVSRMVHTITRPTANNKHTRTLYLTGIKSDGTKSKQFKLAKLWRPLIDTEFKVSHMCCDIFKKDPFIKYEQLTGRKPIAATTAAESASRRVSYMKTGCNSFGEKPMSRPFSIFTDDDVWNYHDQFKLKFAAVYYRRKVTYLEDDGKLRTEYVDGENRTGCMICLIGPPKQIVGRIERLRKTHNKQWRFFMDGKPKMRRAIELIGSLYKKKD